MAEHRRASLVNEALTMAIQRRQPPPGVLMHTDRGSQYGANSYIKILNAHGIQPSMSRQGNC
jgi:transposase InsO family protein